MSELSDKLDEILNPVLDYAKKVEGNEPIRAANIRRIAGETRVELAKLEAVCLELNTGLSNKAKGASDG